MQLVELGVHAVYVCDHFMEHHDDDTTGDGLTFSTPPLEALTNLLDAQEQFLLTFPELDHYEDRGDERYDGPLTAARAKLADARFAAFGDSVYPDATFSLRITYGKVGGWVENGRKTDYRTRFAGAYDRVDQPGDAIDVKPVTLVSLANFLQGIYNNFSTQSLTSVHQA